MTKKYDPEEIDKILKTLPEELKEAFFSMETADAIWNACERNDVNEVSKVAEQAGYVLLGILMPDDFQVVLEKEVKLEKETAKKVAREINRFVFYPVRPALEQLYGMRAESSEKETGKKPEIALPLAKESAAPAEPRKEDSYREPIE